MLLEICANSVESVLAAQEGGADRVELCSSLAEGGITPSLGVIQLAKEKSSIGLHVLIRPRGGDFCYSDIEMETMIRDINNINDIGADGVVIGILTPEGMVDTARCMQLIAAAAPMSVTFHRAFDMTADPIRSLEDIIAVGANRILTSGQKNKAIDGIPLLAELVQRAGARIKILIGSGVNELNIKEIALKTGAEEFHFSGSVLMQSRMIYRNSAISMGGNANIPDYEYPQTDPGRVRRVVSILREIQQ